MRLPKTSEQRAIAFGWVGYTIAVTGTVAAALIRWGLGTVFEGQVPPYITFYPVVLLSAAVGGTGPGVVATMLSALIVDWLFLKPVGRFGPLSPADAVGILLFVGINIGISVVGGRLRAAHNRIRTQSTQMKDLCQMFDLGNVMVRNLDDRITLWSNGNARLYGYATDQAVGRISHELLQTRFLESAASVREAFFRNGRWQGELIQRRADGREIIVASEWELRRDASGAPVAILETSSDLTERKHYEEELRLQAATLEATANAIIITDGNGTIKWANPAFERLTGYAVAEAVGQNPRLVKSGQHDDAFFKEMWNTILTGRVWRGEVINRRKDGALYHEEMTITPLKDSGNGVTHFVAVKQDITDRKKAENALTIATARLDGIIASAMDAMISINAAQQIVIFNPAAAAMFGVAANEAIGQNLNRFIPERFRAAHIHHVERFGATGVTSRQMGTLGAIRGLRANGEEFAIEASISQVDVGGEKLFTVILRDITRRQQTEQALRENEEKLRLAISGADLGTWDWDLERNTQSWSKRCKEMLGLDPEAQISYEGFMSTLEADARQHIQETVDTTLRGKTEFNVEFRVCRPDGTLHWINARGRGFYRDDGQPSRMTGTVQDITDIVLARETLARSREDLERLVEERTSRLRETVADLEHFSYSITHDMRAPLRAMQGFAELLEHELGGTSPAGWDYCRRIKAAANRMDNLIRDALDYAKVVRHELPLGEVDAGRLLREIIEVYPEFQQPLAEISLGFEKLAVIANQGGLTQCFSNLLANAVKFVAPGVKPRVQIRAEAREKKVRIWIEDNGVGIPPDQAARIFGMFQRLHTEREFPGTGIGLTLVRKASERMGGKVGFESEVGTGSRFWLEFAVPPKAQSEPDLPNPGTAPTVAGIDERHELHSLR